MLSILMPVALALAQPPASYGAAPSAAALQPLAAGEVLLEVNGAGTATAQADKADLTVTITGRGPTSAAAKAAHDAAYDRLLREVRAAGVDPATISRIYYGENPDLSDATLRSMRADPAPQAPEPQRFLATGSYTLPVPDPERARQLSAALSRLQDVSSTVAYSLSEDAPARLVARRDALAKARASADAYAAALNLRVVRMVRVTERTGFNVADMFAMGAGMESRMRSMRDASSRQVSTLAYVGVDYVLGPR